MERNAGIVDDCIDADKVSSKLIFGSISAEQRGAVRTHSIL